MKWFKFSKSPVSELMKGLDPLITAWHTPPDGGFQWFKNIKTLIATWVAVVW
ncbi:MAG: hypothetical protein NTX88_06895 [Candidatus Atribacteria bacterium]|nr:hypothetical protein [Candidatus Atribacteria bacterium]